MSNPEIEILPTENKEEHEETNTTNILINYKDSTGIYIYIIFHMIMAFVSVFLSWKCNNGTFDVVSFLVAIFFPYIYIIYILATKGTCDATVVSPK